VLNCLTAILNCSFEQNNLDKEYMELYTPGQMKNNLIYSHILYNYYLSNAFQFKLGYNFNVSYIEIQVGAGKQSMVHVFKPSKGYSY